MTMAVPRPDPLPCPNFSKRTYVEQLRNWWTELATYLPGPWYDHLGTQDNWGEVSARKIARETLRKRFQQLNMFIDDNAGDGTWEPVRYLGEGTYGR